MRKIEYFAKLLGYEKPLAEKEERCIVRSEPDCSDYDDPIPNSKAKGLNHYLKGHPLDLSEVGMDTKLLFEMNYKNINNFKLFREFKEIMLREVK